MSVQWKNAMKTRISGLITEAKSASQSPDAYVYLPGIIETLELIQVELDKERPDTQKLLKRVGGLVRLVTETYAFSESLLGTKLLDLADDIVYQFDPRFQERKG